MSAFTQQQLKQMAQACAARIEQAATGEQYFDEPYKHIIIDKFFDAELADRCLQNFPAPADPCWEHANNADIEVKLRTTWKSEFDIPEAIVDAVRILNSAPVLNAMASRGSVIPLFLSQLQTQARAVVSDSGTITEELSILNFPAINMREVHERPEGFEEAAVMFTGLSVERVMNAMGVLQNQPRGQHRALRMVADYEADNVSDKVLRIVMSYTDFLNRKVWHKADTP
jgi:UDP-N-acetylglucosamine 2-epimerase